MAVLTCGVLHLAAFLRGSIVMWEKQVLSSPPRFESWSYYVLVGSGQITHSSSMAVVFLWWMGIVKPRVRGVYVLLTHKCDELVGCIWYIIGSILDFQPLLGNCLGYVCSLISRLSAFSGLSAFWPCPSSTEQVSNQNSRKRRMSLFFFFSFLYMVQVFLGQHQVLP